jgi:hypothetical protein
MFNEINEKSKVKINQINLDIDIKLNELFNLFLENTLTSNELNIEKIKDFAPKHLIEDMRTNNPIKFKNRMVEIKEIMKTKFFEQYDNEMWMDHMNSNPLIPTNIDGYLRKETV